MLSLRGQLEICYVVGCTLCDFLLHAQSVKELTSQLEELKEQKDNRLGEEVSSVSCRPQEDEGGEVLRLNGLLEKTEKELFETRTRLEAKVSILHCRPNLLLMYLPSSVDTASCSLLWSCRHIYTHTILLAFSLSSTQGILQVMDSSLGMRLFYTTPYFCSDWGRKGSTVLCSGVKFTFHRLQQTTVEPLLKDLPEIKTPG